MSENFIMIGGIVMKKKLKRAVSSVISLILLYSMLGLTTIVTNAAEIKDESVSATAIKTRDEAVAWLKSQGGASYNIDTSTEGTQCVEFVKVYVNWLMTGNPWSDVWNRPTLNGWQIWQNSLWKELGWSVYYNTADFMPQPGDIFSSGTTAYGHTGVVISSDLNSAVIADANADSPYNGTPVKIHTISWKSANSNSAYGATHYIRPNFKPKENPVTGAWIKETKTRFPIGESNTFTFGATNATYYNMRIDKDGALWKYQDHVSSGISYTFSEEGSYTIYVTARNNSSYADSSKLSFSVFRTLNFGSSFSSEIISPFSGKCVTADDNENLIMLTKNDNESQKWHFTLNQDNTYRITNLKYNKCLDVYGSQKDNGTDIVLYNATQNDNQKWYIVPSYGGYGLVPKSNTNAALDITGGYMDDGINMQEWIWNSSKAQAFSIDAIDLIPNAVIDYNGHHYEYYHNNMPWNQAYRFCEKKGGHLVTITSTGESSAIVNLTNGYSGRAWIGLNRNGNSWAWVNSEPYVENNFWNTGEPNNTYNYENNADFYMSGSSAGKWNDEYALNSNVEGFICEYDDVVNENDYTPNCSVSNNGYLYELYDYNVDWQTAERICEKKGGTLATIYDSNENNIVAQLAANGSKNEYWIGVNDIESEGIWKLVDGKSVQYTNWLSGNPDNDYGCEEYVAIGKEGGQWYDLKGYSFYYRSVGFICKKSLYEIGDVNLNGKININDVTSIQMYLAELEEFTDEQLAVADVNGDGEVDINDATYLQMYLADLVDKLG